MRKKIQFTCLALVAATLSACGGGGTGGNDPVLISAIATGSNLPNLTVPTGSDYSFTVTADSADNALSSLSWSVLASGGAPAITPANLNCGTVEKVDTPQMNGLVSSVWRCTITGKAPASLGTDAAYSFTASAVNTKGSKATAVTQLTVKAPTGDAAVPKVEVSGPSIVNAEATAEFGCEATGGYLATGDTYKLRWESEAVSSVQVQFDNRSQAKVKATMPAVADATTFQVTCKATDSAGKVGTSSRSVEVKPASPTAKITGSETGSSEGSVALTCTGEGGYMPSGSTYSYSWTSSSNGGKGLSFDKADTSSIVATIPKVTANSAFTATCMVTDKAGRSATATRTITVTP